MKKTLLLCIVCLVATIGMALCACSAHQHTFDLSHWEQDDTYHWRKTTCGHDEMSEKERHVFNENGNDCMVCGHHVHNKLTFVDDREATCDKAGAIAHWECTCGACFDSETGGNELESSTVIIPAKGHDKDLVYHEAVAAYCMTYGTKEYWECGSCGAKFDKKEGGQIMSDTALRVKFDTQNHKTLEFIPAKERTCGAEGNIEYYRCPECLRMYDKKENGKELTRQEVFIPPDDSMHQFPLTPFEAKEPDCMHTGNIEYWKCERCQFNFDKEEGGNKLAEGDEILPKNPYKHVGTIERVEMEYGNCYDKGLKAHYQCSECGRACLDETGNFIVEMDDLSTVPLGHYYVNAEAKYDDDTAEQGHYYSCRRCGEPETISNLQTNYEEKIRMYQHTFDKNGVCEECGYKTNDPQTSTDENRKIICGVVYEYTTDSEGKKVAKVVSAKLNSWNTYVIKDKITVDNEEYEVTEVGKEAFKSINKITLLIVPKTVKKIEDKAFWGGGISNRLTINGLVIGSDIEYGTNVFSSAIMTIYYLGTSDEFQKDTKLQNAYKNANTQVSKYFYSEKYQDDNSDLWHFVGDPDEIPELWSNETITYNEKSWVDVVTGLEYTLNKVTSGKNTATVKQYNWYEEKVVVVPEKITVLDTTYTVTGIAARAFDVMSKDQDNRYLAKAIILPKTITSIGEYAFNAQSKVEYLVLGGILESLGEEAFSGLPSTAQFFFNGNEKAYVNFKNAIDKIQSGPYITSKLRSMVRYYYKASAPTKSEDEKYWHYTNVRHTAAESWFEDRCSDSRGFNYVLNTQAMTAMVIGGSVVTCRIPETITHNGATYTVTSIKDSAFAVLPDAYAPILAIEIPKTIKKIGESAFAYQVNCVYIIFHGKCEIGEGAFTYVGSYLQPPDLVSLKIYYDGTYNEMMEFITSSNSAGLSKCKYFYLDSDTTAPQNSYDTWKYENNKIVEVPKNPV